jgi:hypothetical protein
MLSLRCLLLEDGPEQIFTIEIDEEKDVSLLKKRIKREAALCVPAKALTLLRVFLPLDNIDAQLSVLDPDKCPKLLPTKKLSSLFHNTPEDYLHVWVKLPCTSH